LSDAYSSVWKNGEVVADIVHHKAVFVFVGVVTSVPGLLQCGMVHAGDCYRALEAFTLCSGAARTRSFSPSPKTQVLFSLEVAMLPPDWAAGAQGDECAMAQLLAAFASSVVLPSCLLMKENHAIESRHMNLVRGSFKDHVMVLIQMAQRVDSLDLNHNGLFCDQ
jgi:hypothetical protein